MSKFEAYLDDFNLINVYINKNFFNGKSDVFYIVDEYGVSKPLTIRNVENMGTDYIAYQLHGSEHIEIGNRYTILEEHASNCALQYRFITKTKQFNDLFFYDGLDLGANYTSLYTEFVLWAPTATEVRVDIEVNDEKQVVPMQRKEKGIFKAKVEGDLAKATYTYMILVNGKWNQTIDPYGKSSIANSSRSAVIDFASFQIDQNDHCLPKFDSYVDAILYEVSVRDFSISNDNTIKHKGKFLGLIEENAKNNSNLSVGMDYINELGVTHVQLMPVYDFATVNEVEQKLFYNWGYDPISHMMPEGSYASDAMDPYSRVRELKQVISTYHKKGIRLIMDVVFNHVYDVDTSPFDKTVPYYYFRYGNYGSMSNGSFCGNDFDSKMKMGQKYIVDACKMWIQEYGFDGFRFDLMGIVDFETMNLVYDECFKLKKDIMVYGEGWNMPTALHDDEKGSMMNQYKMPNIAHFNDYYREHIKGPTNHDQIKLQGYMSGNTSYAESIKAALTGNTQGMYYACMFDTPTKSINYVECHDNNTLWDKLKECCKNDIRENRMKKQKMMIGALLVSQGIPFIHCGQEFCRTKNGQGNSFRSNDLINQIEWSRRDTYSSVVEYTKDLIQLRKEIPAFRFRTKEDIEQHVSFDILYDGVVIYKLSNLKHQTYQDIQVIFNPTDNVIYHDLNDSYQMLANESGTLHGVEVTHLTISPYSMIVLAKK